MFKEKMYILQDMMDPRLYFKGTDNPLHKPSFTANEDVAPVFNEEDSRFLSSAYNLKRVKI